MVAGHYQYGGLRVDSQGGKRDGGCGVAGARLEQQSGVSDADGGQLFVHQWGMRGSGNDDWRSKPGKVIAPLHGHLEHGLRTRQREKLFGMIRTRHRP
jgi:hypothetical protein